MKAEDLEFEIGDVVYHRLSGDPGMVTGIHLRPSGITYSVTWEDRCETPHYEIELTLERDFNPGVN